MKVNTNTSMFLKDMQNIVNYSMGFLEGVSRGKRQFLDNLGKNSVDVLKDYVDTMARVDQPMLQHMYEWDKAGSPDARLFDIEYTVSNLGLSIKSSFRQSTSVKSGSKVPFYDKARIMEEGIPVTIKPTRAKALRFEVDGEEVFSKGPVRVNTPGGEYAAGGFQKTIDRFFSVYFTQAFLFSSGIAQYLKNPFLYKKNLPAGKRSGRPAGISTGYKWIANAGVDK